MNEHPYSPGTPGTSAPDSSGPQSTDQRQAPAGGQGGAAAGNRLDPAFFACVNEYLEMANRQSKQQGLKRISMASLYAAARFNSHVYLAHAQGKAGDERNAFLDYMTTLYRRMLNESLDGLGAERGLDVGESELAAEMAAASAPAESASG